MEFETPCYIDYDNIPVSTISPTNIFAIPDTTIVIGTDILALPVMLVNSYQHREASHKTV